MSNEPNWDAAVGKLRQMTEDGTIEWVADSRVEGVREEVVAPGYHAEVSGRNVIVYEYRHKTYIYEDRYEWENEVAIEFVSGTLQLQYAWPEVGGRWQLLDAIRFQVSG